MSPGTASASLTPGVEAAGDDIDEGALGDEVQGDPRVTLLEGRDDVPQQPVRTGPVAVDAQRADHLVSAITHAVQRLVQRLQDRRQALQQLRAIFRERHAARGPVQQPHAHALFEILQRVAERRTRDAQRIGGFLETAVPRDFGEGPQIRQRDIGHC